MNTSNTHIIFDRLYGQIEVEHDEWKFFQTTPLARLRHVSLSAVPTWALPAGTCASKFEHSVGVAHLAKIIGANKLFHDQAKNLYLAALLHDIGTPPFSHMSEHFLEAIVGKNHEQFAADAIYNPQLTHAIKNFGSQPETIIKLITGQNQPLSDLINGSIDIDNLDNSLRWGLSVGVLSRKFYSPTQIAAYYTKARDHIAFSPGITRQIRGWEMTRKLVYKLVYSPTNLSPAVMLLRALYFAAQANELDDKYFLMTDEEAFIYLSTCCNTITKQIMNDLHEWHFYLPAFNYSFENPSLETMQIAKNIFTNEKQADTLAGTLHLPPELISVHTSRDRTYKNVHLPLVGKFRNLNSYQPSNKLTWRVDVYVHPSLTDKISKITNYMQEQYGEITI